MEQEYDIDEATIHITFTPMDEGVHISFNVYWYDDLYTIYEATLNTTGKLVSLEKFMDGFDKCDLDTLIKHFKGEVTIHPRNELSYWVNLISLPRFWLTVLNEQKLKELIRHHYNIYTLIQGNLPDDGEIILDDIEYFDKIDKDYDVIPLLSEFYSEWRKERVPKYVGHIKSKPGTKLAKLLMLCSGTTLRPEWQVYNELRAIADFMVSI